MITTFQSDMSYQGMILPSTCQNVPVFFMFKSDMSLKSPFALSGVSMCPLCPVISKNISCWFPLVDKRLVPTAPLMARFRL